MTKAEAVAPHINRRERNDFKHGIDKKSILGLIPKKWNLIAATVLAAGLILLLMSGITGESNDSNGILQDDESLAFYAEQLESSLSEIVSSIEGAGRSLVMITFDSSFESVYAYNAGVTEKESGIEATGRTTEKELVITGRQSDESPVLVKKLCPKVKGVLVVCEGGENTAVKESIAVAASTLLGVPESRICVTASEKQVSK